MKIISHRGLWDTPEERNSKKSFTRSFSSNFGLETDIRDYRGELVISHDIPLNNCLSIDDLFLIYNSFKQKNLYEIALNIKSDGLQSILFEKIKQYNITNYFVFDMSIPDTIGYIDKGIKFFIRESEIEKKQPFYDNASGIWLDCFYNDWIEEKLIEKHLKKDKKICLVSPELHNRDYKKFWNKLKNMDIISCDKIIICTDFPEVAKKFFE